MPTTTEPESDAPQPARRRRVARRLNAARRRPLPAGRVWVVGLVALLVGALLNAPGIRKTALSQPVGWKRDVATFFADPLYDVSHALYLDRLRLGLQDLVGRDEDDDIDLSLPSPTIPSTTTTTAPPDVFAPTTQPPRPNRPEYSPTKQARLWTGGDSLAITPGQSIINAALATQVIGIVRPVDGHVATGLARPEVFNWPAYLAQVISVHDPDVMVLTLGSNDDQALTGEGGVGPFGSEAWQKEYRRRVGGLMDAVTGSGDVTLFWIGIPQMRNVGRYESRYKLINEIIRSEAEKRRGKVGYVDTAKLLAGPDGGYTDFVVRLDGSVVRVRSGDGIHFERAGADRIANAVVAALHQAFDLTSWQSAPSTTTTTSTTSPRARGTTTTRPRDS